LTGHHPSSLQICHSVLRCVLCPQKDSSHDAIKEELTSISKARREELNYIYVDPSGNDGALEYFGLKSKDIPAFVIHDQGKDAKYVSKNIAVGSLGSWLDEFKVRKLLMSDRRACHVHMHGYLPCLLLVHNG